MEEYMEVLYELSLGSDISRDLMQIIKKESESLLLNIPLPTMGGKIFWEDIVECNGWKLQQNLIFQNARIINKNNIRIAWGSLKDMMSLMNKLLEHIHNQKLTEKQENFSIMQEIKNLKELLDNGTITQNEFQQKKDELMKKIHTY